MRFRTAVIGVGGGFAFLVAFAYLAGLPVWLGVAFFLIYFAIAVSVTRMRAELGPPTHDLHFIGPDQSLSTIIGTRNLSGGALAVFTLFYWFNRAYRCHPMPHQLEGFKMAQLTRTSPRGLLFAMMLAAFVGILSTFWVTLHVSYQMGAAARIHGWSSLGFGREAYDRLASWFTAPTDPNTGATTAMVDDQKRHPALPRLQRLPRRAAVLLRHHPRRLPHRRRLDDLGCGVGDTDSQCMEWVNSMN